MKKFLPTAVAIVLVSLAVMLPDFWMLAPVGLATFFYDIHFATQTRNGAFVRGFIFGFLVSSASLSWWWDALPFDWLPLGQAVSMLVIAVAWTMVSASLGFANALTASLAWTMREAPGIELYIPFLWVGTEILRMWTFALLTFGPESILGPHFSITMLGYGLAENHNLLQLAAGGGVNNLNFFVGGIASICAFLLGQRAWKKQNSSIMGVSAVFMLLLASFIYAQFEQRPTDAVLAKPLTVSILPTTKYHEYTTTLNIPKTLRTLADKNPDLIVFPEDESLATYFNGSHDAELQRIFGSRDVILMSTQYGTGQEGNYAELVYTSSRRGEVLKYQKIFLMPESEQNPYLSSPIYSVLNNDVVNNYFGDRKFVHRGTSTPVMQVGSSIVGGLICSDILSPHLYAAQASQGAQVLVNVSNPTWFHDSALLYRRTVELARVHAVQHRAYFVLANKEAPSIIISPSGETVVETGWGDTTPLTAELK